MKHRGGTGTSLGGRSGQIIHLRPSLVAANPVLPKPKKQGRKGKPDSNLAHMQDASILRENIVLEVRRLWHQENLDMKRIHARMTELGHPVSISVIRNYVSYNSFRHLKPAPNAKPYLITDKPGRE